MDSFSWTYSDCSRCSCKHLSLDSWVQIWLFSIMFSFNDFSEIKKIKYMQNRQISNPTIKIVTKNLLLQLFKSVIRSKTSSKTVVPKKKCGFNEKFFSKYQWGIFQANWYITEKNRQKFRIQAFYSCIFNIFGIVLSNFFLKKKLS